MTSPRHDEPVLSIAGSILTLLMAATTAHAIEPKTFGRINIEDAVSALPKTSHSVLEERRLVDNGTTGVRVFRVYKPVPRHHHKFSDTYLQILSGRAEISINGGAPFVARAGELVFWRANVDHEVTRIIEEPVIFLAFDSPVRRKGDVTFFSKTAPEPHRRKR